MELRYSPVARTTDDANISDALPTETLVSDVMALKVLAEPARLTLAAGLALALLDEVSPVRRAHVRAVLR